MFNPSSPKAPSIHASIPWSRTIKYKIFNEAHFDWGMLLIAGIMTSLVLVYIGVQAYQSTMDTLDAPVVDAAVSTRLLDTNVLLKDVTYLKNRADEYSTYVRGTVTIPDPSR